MRLIRCDLSKYSCARCGGVADCHPSTPCATSCRPSSRPSGRGSWRVRRRERGSRYRCGTLLVSYALPSGSPFCSCLSRARTIPYSIPLGEVICRRMSAENILYHE